MSILFDDIIRETPTNQTRPMKVRNYIHLFIMQRGLPYTTDWLLSRRPFNYIVQPLSLLQKKVLFEKHLRIISLVGSKGNPKYKRIGTRYCRRLRAIAIGSALWPSPTTRSCWRQRSTTKQSRSGTRVPALPSSLSILVVISRTCRLIVQTRALLQILAVLE